MICKECGAKFEEGIFCPKCGANNEESVTEQQGHAVVLDDEYQKARTILNEYEHVEEEKRQIMKLGWSNADDIETRIRERVKIYQRAKALELQTNGAKQYLQKMRDEISEDYHEYKEKDRSLGAQIFWMIVFSVLAICFLFPLGIIGIIIGVFVILGGCSAVVDVVRTKHTLEELKIIMKDIQELNRVSSKGNGEVMFCKYCGKQISRTIKFCNFCGAKVN